MLYGKFIKLIQEKFKTREGMEEAVFFRPYFPEKTISTMDEFLRSKKYVFALEAYYNIWWIVANPYYVDKTLYSHSITMSKLKTRQGLEEEDWKALLYLLKLRTRVWKTDTDSYFLKDPVELRATTSNDLDFGNIYFYGMLVKQGNYYGDTTSFPLIGITSSPYMADLKDKFLKNQRA